MSIAFSRSMRSLYHDSFRPSLVGLMVAIVLLAAWCIWFFLARVTLYETSQTFQIRRDGSLDVTFSSEALSRIQSGQPAIFRTTGTAEKQAETFPAMVMNVPTSSENKPVEVYVFSEEPLRSGLSGQVQVEVEYVSPAVLVMRSAGQLVDSPQLSVSPQKQ